ncbi:MAG: fatty acid--CoA ligase [Betaproteobacteria bacterium]|nr:MAG: fatty acid--CoA ligase [Betaproteobacteria bacterium]
MKELAITRTPSACDASLLIGGILDHGVANAPKQQIVYGDRVRYTYTKLGERVARLASALSKLGVKPGSTVAMMDWDSHRYLECFLAVPMMGAVLHTVNVRISPDQVLYTINHAQDDVILVNAEFLPLLETIHSKIRPGIRFVLINDGPAAPNSGIEFSAEYESMVAAASPSYDFPILDEHTRATTFYTTGTTGLPKGVYYSHRQLVLHTLAVSHALGQAPHAAFAADDVYMPITPMFHVHAWGLPYVATMLGVKQVYPGRYVPEVLLELIRREGVTFSHCVPTILQMMLGKTELREVDLSKWKVIIGGSALPLPLARSAAERGVDIIAGYGMSETCPILTLAHLRPHMSEWSLEQRLPYLCRAGRPIPFVQLRIVDTEMNDVVHDGVSQGEVVVRAPWLTQGYLSEPERSEELWRGGWLHTGDVGVIDSEGYLKIVDRIKDVVKTGGEWVSSLDIEDIILRVPGVAEAAVVGVPDDKWGERPVALVVLKPQGELPTEDAIRTQVGEFAGRGAISRYAVPDRVYFVDVIPKTSVGKLDKKVIRAKLLSGDAVAAGASAR